MQFGVLISFFFHILNLMPKSGIKGDVNHVIQTPNSLIRIYVFFQNNKHVSQGPASEGNSQVMEVSVLSVVNIRSENLWEIFGVRFQIRVHNLRTRSTAHHHSCYHCCCFCCSFSCAGTESELEQQRLETFRVQLGVKLWQFYCHLTSTTSLYM